MKTKDKLTKNRLLWSIAMVLIVVSAVPAAYAQTGESSMFFVLINSAVVAVVLFILQALLIQKPNAKERTGSYIWVLLLSLLIGFLFGRSGYIWQGYFGRYFNIYTLINAIIIGTVIYILLGFKIKMDSPEGKGGYTILIFIVSLIFAVNIGPHWIWELSTAKQFWVYLVGPNGILNPNPPAYRLWVFIGSFTLMAYFFVGYIGKDINQFVSYGISLVIAVSMTQAGLGLPVLIKIAEIVFLIVLADSLKGPIDDGRFKWGLSYVIVGWVSASVTAALGKEYQGIIGGMMAPMLRYYGVIPTAPGDPVGFGGFLFSIPALVILAIFIGMWAAGGDKDGWIKTTGKVGVIVWVLLLLFASWNWLGSFTIGKILLFVLIPAAILIFILFGMARGERRAGVVRGRIVPFFWNKLAKSLREGSLSKIPLLRRLKLRNIAYQDKLHQTLLDNRILMYALSNYCLREDIYHAKNYFFPRTMGIVDAYKALMSQHIDLVENVKKQLVMYRSNVPRPGQTTIGWSYYNNLLVDDLNLI